MKAKTGTCNWRAIALATLVGSAMLAGAPAARAGECPADKMGANVTLPNDMMATGVSDMVLASIDLGSEPAKIDGRMFRLRRLEIEPGGVVSWHSHADRPALIYLVKGEITEHSSDCAVPILHKAGDVSRETHQISHWWKNTGTETVVLISADLLRDPSDKNM